MASDHRGEEIMKGFKRVKEFDTPYTCIRAIKEGGIETKLSMFLMGFGNMVHGQKMKGLLYLAIEVFYIVFMIFNGAGFIAMLPSLGSAAQQEIWDEVNQVYMYTKGDQSVLILLYGVATVLLTVLMFLFWRGALKSAYKAECLHKAGRHVNNFREDLKSLLHENLQKLLMTPSLIFIFGLTVLPLIFMICMAFTNYSKIGNHLTLFDWVGLDNFKALFDSSSILGSTFWSVLVWTIVWAFFATFTNYFFGMILAILINRKETKAKGFSVTRKYIFQLGGIAPFKGYAVFSCLSVFFCSICGSVGKWISPTKLKTISTF